MDLLTGGCLTIIIILLLVAASWWRGRSGNSDSSGIEPWMLEVQGLNGLCNDYLYYIREMSSGRYSSDELRELDSQRQVTHDQLLGYLGLDRSAPLDMAAFARRYLRGDR